MLLLISWRKKKRNGIYWLHGTDSRSRSVFFSSHSSRFDTPMADTHGVCLATPTVSRSRSDGCRIRLCRDRERTRSQRQTRNGVSVLAAVFATSVGSGCAGGQCVVLHLADRPGCECAPLRVVELPTRRSVPGPRRSFEHTGFPTSAAPDAVGYCSFWDYFSQCWCRRHDHDHDLDHCDDHDRAGSAKEKE